MKGSAVLRIFVRTSRLYRTWSSQFFCHKCGNVWEFLLP